MDKKMRDKVRKIFDHDNIEVCRQEIRCYYYHDAQGKDWVPYGGGPLYGKSAKDQAAWLTRHVTEFRELLPKAIRDYKIVYGELSTRNYPGEFRALPLPEEQAA